MKNLYKFHADCGRQGELNGVFLAEPEEAAAIVGKYCYFGEALGKHSEVSGNIEPNEISLVTDNRDFLDIADKLNINITSGLNPLYYVRCEECSEEMNVLDTECKSCAETNK